MKDVGEKSIAGGILNLTKFSLTSKKETRTKGDNSKGLSNLPDIIFTESSVLLAADLNNQPVIGKIGNIVARLPYGHFFRNKV